MSMGRSFDPLRQSISELKRRAKRFCTTHGRTSHAEKDGEYHVVKERGVYVYVDSHHLVIRAAVIDESRSWKPLVWTLVYSEDNRGNATSIDRQGLIPETVKRLRQLQILDDLANV